MTYQWWHRKDVVSGFRLRVKLQRTVAAALVCLTLAGQIAAAQSLGDIAQREAERRKQTTSGRVYTNADLAPVDASAPSPPAPVSIDAAPLPGPETPAALAAKPSDNPGAEPVIVKPREKRDEQYWRTLARDLRSRVAKVNAERATQEARIAEIDAGPQTPTAVREREVISVTLTRLRRDAGSHAQELTRFMTRAQLAKVPEEWIR
ncbi:MAG: hypothetical protein HYX77_03110 [Acidobacteria bacterium]|nr:hypothetical protein [Acidobacteriota bacterium]